MYCTIDDLLTQIDKSKLIELTNDRADPAVDENGQEIIHEGNAKSAIDAATAVVNTYVAMRYPVPLSPVPPIVNKLTVDIAIYNLFTRHYNDEDNVFVRRYRDAIRLLEKIAADEVKLSANESSIRMHSRRKVYGESFQRMYD
ncbi:DUF1320 domain-containing protein [Brevibacillus composti]|uniref:DUF1320 domain-containing protein n=1 Tax=Brevibacillus composti TaxID=2796470 RepID=A0ABX7Z8X8_9BACL|nr:DUF1320 domain-containing protein [Brevibacillus composti]QUO43451.1 DUF1320 domain-containing protein [Brevibacillus composti]